MKKGVIAAGNWLVDHIKTIDRWPGEGNLCNILSEETACGGGPCNLLFDLASMTSEIPLFASGRVGNDPDGSFILNEVRRRGIHSSLLLKTQTATSHTDVISGGAKRTFFHFRGANSEFAPEDLTATLPDAKIFYLGYLLLLDTLDSQDPEYGTKGARLLSRIQKQGMTTVVDFVSEAPEKFRNAVQSAIPWIDVLVINEIEAGNAFSLEIRKPDSSLDSDSLENAASLFLKNGVRKMIVIHYPEGAFAMTQDGEKFQIASRKIDHIVGTNGAGDAFCAGVVYGLHEDWTIPEILRIAEASARCNLSCASASGGAKSIEFLKKMMMDER